MPYTLLAATFAACTVYAILLSTPVGKVLTETYPWITVVIGTGLVLALYYVMAPNADPLVFWCFVAGGTPIVARSLWIEVRREMAWRKELRHPQDS